jgi:hypothetical protein
LVLIATSTGIVFAITKKVACVEPSQSAAKAQSKRSQSADKAQPKYFDCTSTCDLPNSGTQEMIPNSIANRISQFKRGFNTKKCNQSIVKQKSYCSLKQN